MKPNVITRSMLEEQINNTQHNSTEARRRFKLLKAEPNVFKCTPSRIKELPALQQKALQEHLNFEDMSDALRMVIQYF